MVEKKMTLGFIGLGQMGAPLAKRLLDAGHKLYLFDMNPNAYATLDDMKQARICQSVQDIVQQSSLIFTCLPTEKAIHAVYLEKGGALDAGQAGLITCDISTATPALVKKLHRQLLEKGIDHFEAPVFGTSGNVIAGDAYFALSGAENLTDKVAPYLLDMGRGYQYVGESGSASLMKILQNSLGYGYAILTAEILTLCKTVGADAGQFVKLVGGAQVMGWSKYFELYADDLVAGRESGTGHLQIAAKDTQLLKAILDENNFNAPVLEEAVRLFKMASDRGMGREDFTAVSRLVEEFSVKK